MWKIVAMCLGCMVMAGSVAAQGGSVVMPSREVTLKQALEELRRQTGYMPIINYDNISPSKVVALSSENLNVDELMRQALAGTGFTHEVVGRRLLIVPQAVWIDDGKGAIGAMWREEEIDESVEMETITFRIGSSVPESRFMDNSRALARIGTLLTDTAVVARIDHISVTAASSPDGNTESNERLAIRRALSTKGYLEKRYPHIAPERVYAFSVGEEWTGLRKLVAEDLRTPDRADVLDLLDNTPDEVKRDSLRLLGGGRAWRYIASNLFPRLRGATAVTLHFRDALAERRIDTVGVAGPAGIGAAALAISGVQRVEILSVKAPPPVEPPPVELPPVVEPPRPLMALKTNLLFDAASALNLELEIPIGDRWSVAGEVIFPWWMMTAGTLEARYWPGDRASRPLLTGWFAGAYVGGGVYDFNWNSLPHKGNFFHAGLSGGYAHTINRDGRLRMEYSLGIGYLKAGAHNWFGPTRAKVSLVWMLNRRSSEK